MFGSKKSLGKKIFGVVIIILCQSKFLVKKKLDPKKFEVKKLLGQQKILSPSIWVNKFRVGKNVKGKIIFGP